MNAVYPTGKVFLDANIFLFDVFADPGYGAYCRDLILKVEDEEIMGITSVMVLDEVLFKMLIAEAASKWRRLARQIL